jgi:hypothetical protein
VGRVYSGKSSKAKREGEDVKVFEITDNIFILGGPEITDSRDGCVYLINLEELILVDSEQGGVLTAHKNIEKMGFDPRNLSKYFSPIATLTTLEVLQKSEEGLGQRYIFMLWMPLQLKKGIPF